MLNDILGKKINTSINIFHVHVLPNKIAATLTIEYVHY